MTGALDVSPDPGTPADERILDATLAVLASDGVAGVSMRAVAQRAEVAVGLANYYFENKTALICAALKRVGDQDLLLIAPADGVDPEVHLRASLHRALDPTYLTKDYLSLRLQLWSLAGVDEKFAEINRVAQRRYLGGLSGLISAARPELSLGETEHRAADVLIVQNGVWLTAILIADESALKRAAARCIELAFG